MCRAWSSMQRTHFFWEHLWRFGFAGQPTPADTSWHQPWSICELPLAFISPDEDCVSLKLLNISGKQCALVFWCQFNLSLFLFHEMSLDPKSTCFFSTCTHKEELIKRAIDTNFCWVLVLKHLLKLSTEYEEITVCALSALRVLSCRGSVSTEVSLSSSTPALHTSTPHGAKRTELHVKKHVVCSLFFFFLKNITHNK